MKQILIFVTQPAAAAPLINYLVTAATANHWHITVANTGVPTPLPIDQLSAIPIVSLLPADDTARRSLIQTADLVISLLPANLHLAVATDCLQYKKHLLSPNSIDDSLTALQADSKQQGLLFLHEAGYSNGIGHMSAQQQIHRIRANGGNITSFRSYSGHLLAPDNPWHFKLTGFPQNMALAGMGGAVFKEDNAIVKWPYEQLFDPNRAISIDGIGFLAWYPDRNVVPYMSLYGLPDVNTFIRSTVQYPEFCFGWKNVIELKLTDTINRYQTDGVALQQFFQEHFASHGFGEWIEKQLTARFAQTKQLLEKLQQLLDAEEEAGEDERKALQDFMMVDNQGQLMDVNLDSIKSQAAATVAGQMHEANLSMKQLFYLGMDDAQTLINKGECSAADVLQFAMEQKLPFEPGDTDVAVAHHEIVYELEGQPHVATSTLLLNGDGEGNTATDKTLALPMGIAAQQILAGNIAETGLHIPVMSTLYTPVLKQLEQNGFHFLTTDTVIQ